MSSKIQADKSLPVPVDQSTNWTEILTQLSAGEDLSVAQSSWAMQQIMAGHATNTQIGGFLMALRTKGESVAELLGLTAVMIKNAEPITIAGRTLDIVGTGGDKLGTVNLSTMASLVAAGAGERVVKHGNRGASSTAGAADVIEALGVNLMMETADLARCAEECGITFLFAQKFHPSMKYAAAPRKELGVPTAFNYLGPLTNPAGVNAQALGCASLPMAPILAGVLAQRGTQGLVFRGQDGRDKFTTAAATDVWEVRDGEVTHTELQPEEFGITRSDVAALSGKDGHYNAQIVARILEGEQGPIRDAVLLNAAAGLVAAADSAQGSLNARMKEAFTRAAESLDSGAAASALQRWVNFSQSCS